LYGATSREAFDPRLWVWGTSESEPRVLHTMIRVNDFDAALRFYVDGLGMKALDRFELPSRRVTAQFLGYDSYATGCLELVQRWDAHEPYSHGSGYGHVSIGVADLPAMVGRIEGMGTEINLRPTRLVADGPYVSFVKDPDGYSLELLEFDPKLWVGGTKESQPRFMHTMIRVKDVDAAVHFYTKGLGMKQLDRFEVEVRRATAQFLGFGDYYGWCLELVHNWDAKDPYSHGSGYGHIAIGVPDVTAMMAKLEAMGAETILQPTRLLEGAPDVALLKDPEGYSVELIQTRRN
jgi:lactoylglutathione lyase